ncbi:MAG TPA: AAA family ATPase, partial [Methylovirgula sp.]
MITRLAVSGYRSLRDITLALGPLNVITGANGSGKSNLYRALRLLADIAQGRVIHSLAAEGGLQSVLWAGPETFAREVKSGIHPIEGTVRKNSISLKLGFAGEDYGYAIDLGLPVHPTTSLFGLDPVIKIESLWLGEEMKRTGLLAERRGPLVRVRKENGEWRDALTDLASVDSMMTHSANP